MKPATALAALAAIATLTACNTSKLNITADNPRPATAGANTHSYELLEGQWTVISVDGTAVNAAAADTPYLRFSPDAENPALMDVVAYNGCNFLNGTILLEGSRIRRQGEMASTMRLCPDAPYEGAVSTALEKMHSLNIEKINNESFLYIKNGVGGTLMTLRRHNLSFLDGAWRITAIDGETLPENVGIRMVVDLGDGKVHGEAGCNVMNGSVDIDMQVENGLRFKDVVTTRMFCPNLEYESAFLRALDKTASVMPGEAAGGVVDTASLRDAAGKTVVELRRISREDL